VVRQKYNHSILIVSQLIRGKMIVVLWIEHTGFDNGRPLASALCNNIRLAGGFKKIVRLSK